jgi:hypothetical protein
MISNFNKNFYHKGQKAMANSKSSETSTSKRELTAWNLYFQKHMIILCAFERKKTKGRRLPHEMMSVVAAMWQAEKLAKSGSYEPTFRMDKMGNIVAFE